MSNYSYRFYFTIQKKYIKTSDSYLVGSLLFCHVFIIYLYGSLAKNYSTHNLACFIALSSQMETINILTLNNLYSNSFVIKLTSLMATTVHHQRLKTKFSIKFREETVNLDAVVLFINDRYHVRREQKSVTFTTRHLPVDFHKDSSIAEAHYQQREHIQGDKVEHVVGCFLPAVLEASMCYTLHKVNSFSLNCPENK